MKRIISKRKAKQMWSLILTLVMVIQLLPPMTMPVQANTEVYGELQSNGEIHETNEGNTEPTGDLIEKENVTYLYAADDVTTIAYNAFIDCLHLTTVNLPMVTSIGVQGFYGCSGLTAVNLPMVTSIGNSAFLGCSGLTAVNLPMATLIDVYAFNGCSELTTVNLPAVTSIGECAFYYAALANLTVGAVPPTVGDGWGFGGCPCTTLTIAGGNISTAVAAYNAVDDHDAREDRWFGWPLVVDVPVAYAVTVNEGTGSGGYSSDATVTIEANEPKVGQRFTTWTVAGDSVTLANAAATTTTFTMPANDVAVSANYESIPVTTISFDANGGTGTTASQQISEGSPQALNENTYTREGYRFAGWKTEKNGSGTAFDNSAQFSAATKIEKVTLYAQWSENTFAVSGTVADGNATTIAGAEVKLMNGATIIGAAVTTGADGSFSLNNVPKGDYNLVASKDNFTVTTPVTVLNENITLGAVVLYQILTVNGGAGSGNYSAGTVVTITAAIPAAGQRFTTWTVVGSGVTLAKATDVTTTFIMPGNAVTVTANYEAIPVTSISFDANSGLGDMAVQQISEGSPQALNDNTYTRAGYRFAGWNTEKDGKGKTYADGESFKASTTKESITLYAQWTEKTNSGVTYRSHIQNKGWETTWAADGESAGTEGQSLRLEGIEINLTGENLPVGAHIEYRTHVQNIGWETNWTSDGQIAGTVGQSLRLEAIQIRLVDMPGYSVEYRTHVQNIGWETTWTADGESAGTEGQSLRLEAIEIRLVKTVVPDIENE